MFFSLLHHHSNQSPTCLPNSHSNNVKQSCASTCLQLTAFVPANLLFQPTPRPLYPPIFFSFYWQIFTPKNNEPNSDQKLQRSQKRRQVPQNTFQTNANCICFLSAIIPAATCNFPEGIHKPKKIPRISMNRKKCQLTDSGNGTSRESVQAARRKTAKSHTQIPKSCTYILSMRQSPNWWAAIQKRAEGRWRQERSGRGCRGVAGTGNFILLQKLKIMTPYRLACSVCVFVCACSESEKCNDIRKTIIHCL